MMKTTLRILEQRILHRAENPGAENLPRSEILERMEEIKEGIEGIKEELKDIKKEIGGIKEEIKDVKKEIGEIKDGSFHHQEEVIPEPH